MSTSWASPAAHVKQILHWSLIRMLCCPLRFPLSASKRLPGGTRKSSSDVARCRINSFLLATRSIFLNRGTSSSENSVSVSFDRNERIIVLVYYASRHRSMPGPSSGGSWSEMRRDGGDAGVLVVIAMGKEVNLRDPLRTTPPKRPHRARLDPIGGD